MLVRKTDFKSSNSLIKINLIDFSVEFTKKLNELRNTLALLVKGKHFYVYSLVFTKKIVSIASLLYDFFPRLQKFQVIDFRKCTNLRNKSF